jgi:SAM-dependent methyltransferase
VPPPSDAITWYNANAASAAARFEEHDSAALNDWLADLFPKCPAVIMDVGVGVGSGRDAAWLASLGYEVLAVEPSAAMRAEAIRRHPQKNLRWLDDRLPEMSGPIRADLSADAILLSAVWMHVRPADGQRAFRKLVFLLRPGGLLAVSLQDGPEGPGRDMHPVSLTEIEHLPVALGRTVRPEHSGNGWSDRPIRATLKTAPVRGCPVYRVPIPDDHQGGANDRQGGANDRPHRRARSKP